MSPVLPFTSPVPLMEWNNNMEFLHHGSSPWPYPMGDVREMAVGGSSGTTASGAPISSFFRSATTGTLGPDDKAMERYVSSLRRKPPPKLHFPPPPPPHLQNQKF